MVFETRQINHDGPMKAIKRQLQPLILEALKSFPAVYINGPRQTGKTTLVLKTC